MKILPINDMAAISALVKSANLPADDLVLDVTAADQIAQGSRIEFYGCLDNGSLAGVIGCELLNDVALLRSLVVAENYRCAGLAVELIHTIERVARAAGAHAVYLLTLDADSNFIKQGYSLIERSQSPLAIQATAQFSNLCPGSAKVLIKKLT